MALELLAREYEAEESQTLTTPYHIAKQHEASDDSSAENTVIEDTVIEDTVIQNTDTYIDNILKSQGHHRYSDSVTLTSPNYMVSPNATHNAQHNILQTAPLHSSITPKSVAPPLKYQPSHDFLLIVENLQKQLHQKDSALKLIAKQLKEKQADYETMVNNNDALKKEIQKLQQNQMDIDEIKTQNETINELNDKINEKDVIIQQLTKDIEGYKQITQWLKMQMKVESNEQVISTDSDKHKMSIEQLQQWYDSMIAVDGDDQKQDENELLNEVHSESEDEGDDGNVEDETALLLNTKETNNKSKKRDNRKISSKITGAVENEINDSTVDNAGCCIPWFNGR